MYCLLWSLSPVFFRYPTFSNTIQEWFGVIFIRQGMYRKGIFKFIVDIPAEYSTFVSQLTL